MKYTRALTALTVTGLVVSTLPTGYRRQLRGTGERDGYRVVTQ